jgi:hypothetical protein
VTPLANKDKREYGHRSDQQDAEYDCQYQRGKRGRHVVMVCHRGYSRRQLLANAAIKGFLAAVGQPGQIGQAGPSSSRTYTPAVNQRIYSRDQITEMARRRQKGLINDADWRRWEYELCRASAEGRVRGALSLETGLPVSR